jgi:hypothetical protein
VPEVFGARSSENASRCGIRVGLIDGSKGVIAK